MIRLVATLASAGVRTAVNAVERAVAIAVLRRELGKANAKVADLEVQVARLTDALDVTRKSNLECLRRETARTQKGKEQP